MADKLILQQGECGETWTYVWTDGHQEYQKILQMDPNGNWTEKARGKKVVSIIDDPDLDKIMIEVGNLSFPLDISEVSELYMALHIHLKDVHKREQQQIVIIII